MKSPFLCAFSGHKRDRQKVWDDGYNFRTRCVRCGTPLIQDVARWRPLENGIDLHTDRDPHPRYDRYRE